MLREYFCLPEKANQLLVGVLFLKNDSRPLFFSFSSLDPFSSPDLWDTFRQAAA